MNVRRAVALVVLLAGVGLPARPAAPEETPAVVPVCAAAAPDHAQCFAEILADPHAAEVDGDRRIPGIKPAQLKRAYNFPLGLKAGAGRTIAIVSAFHAPTLQKDLNIFSSELDLPRCTVGNGCLTVVGNRAGDPPPTAVDPLWAFETTLDVQMVHAVAPAAKIIVVEAGTNNMVDLLAGVQHAATLAKYVSGSWGRDEFSLETIFEPIFTSQPTVSFFFASGDIGGFKSYPAMSPNVVAVGGTRLRIEDGVFRRETGWSAGGGGCSDYAPASAAQSGHAGYASSGCAGQRATPDIAAVGDPATGLAVYTSTPFLGRSGWLVVAGTSASSPIIAARAAQTGAVVNQAYVYGNNIAFRDITVGNNTHPCLPGYDLVTGRGSWTG